MDKTIYAFFLACFAIRVYTLTISIRNEKALKRAGGKEYGRINSTVLALLHAAFYVAAFVEGYRKQVHFDGVTAWGLALYILSMLALFFVIRQLGRLWTVKLILAKNHTLNNHFIFRYVRHPNYFLNIIPELIGLGLMMKAYLVLTYLFPVYLVSLATRIWQEERQMRARFAGY